MLGKGDGDETFATAIDYAAEMSPCSVALGDGRGDGRTDLVTANYASDSVSVSFGTGGEHGTSCATGDGPGTVVLGDLNADGKLDYVAVNILDSSVSVLLVEEAWKRPDRG